eukprot:3843244-Pyramimonas_sp.AAC.1
MRVRGSQLFLGASGPMPPSLAVAEASDCNACYVAVAMCPPREATPIRKASNPPNASPRHSREGANILHPA